jgi:phage replication O-like protein O
VTGVFLLNSTQVPNDFIALMPKLSGSAISCFIAICRKTIGWHKRSDRISFTQLTQLTGLGSDAVETGVAELEKEQLITVHRVPGKTNVYDLMFEDDAGEPVSSQDSAGEGTTRKSRVVHPEKSGGTTRKNRVTIDTLKDTLQNNVRSLALYGYGFDEAWLIYPRKVAKQAAWKAYRARIKEGVEPWLLKLATANYSEAVKHTEERFIMHGATFFGPTLRYQDFAGEKPAPKPYVPPDLPPPMTDEERSVASTNLANLKGLIESGKIRHVHA